MRPLNILVYANAPCVPTGFGTVVREIFTHMVDRKIVPIGELNFFGVNFTGDPHRLPFHIWPAQVAAARDPDLFGRARFMHMALNNQWPFDILFVLEDHFTLAHPTRCPDGATRPFLPALIHGLKQQVSQGRPPFRVVQYIPVDALHLSPNWINWMPELVDHPVAYTEFGKRVLLDHDARLRDKLTVIPHGTNPEIFRPITSADVGAFRAKLQVPPKGVLIAAINRNQPRKDIPRTLQVFKQVYDRFPDARLYCHMNAADSAGFNLGNVLAQLRLPGHVVQFPVNFSEGVGVPTETLNLIYNASDILLTTARGEGWGLCLSDAMTVGRPIVAPDHTSHSELLADGRGELVPPLPHGIVTTFDNDVIRPLADVDAMAQAILSLIALPGKRHTIGVTAREWALTHTWRDHVVPQWERLFLQHGG